MGVADGERTLRLADDADCLEALLAQVLHSGRAARLLLNEHDAIEAVEVLAVSAGST